MFLFSAVLWWLPQVVTQDIDLPGVLKDIMVLLVNNKDVTLKLTLKDVPKYVKSDPMYLRQILYNLLSNAIKFTPGPLSLSLCVCECVCVYIYVSRSVVIYLITLRSRHSCNTYLLFGSSVSIHPSLSCLTSHALFLSFFLSLSHYVYIYPCWRVNE